MQDLILNPNNLLLFIAAFAAGMFNGVAGGGSFLSFPALVFAGYPIVEANATSTMALWFGSFASTYAYRHVLLGTKPEGADLNSTLGEAASEVTAADRAYFYALSCISIMGGVLGSVILLGTTDAIFTKIVPYLMVLATTLFALSPTINQWLKSQGKGIRLPFYAALALQFVVAIYGGYFGGGVSILMLSIMNFMGLTNIHAMNGLKSWLGSCMNGVAIAAFVVAGKIAWFPALLMALAAILGAYGSAILAQNIPQKTIRNFVVGIACAMTSYLFLKQWGIA
jgi:uncharacterized protein